MSESDEDVADDLVEFEEMKVSLSDAANTAISVRNGDKKKSMPNIGKNQFVRYMRRHSPLKLRSYCTANETYVMDKTEPAH